MSTHHDTDADGTIRDEMLAAQEDERHCDNLGRIVREMWIAWAKEQPLPKPSWLVPYDQLSEPDKEADRLIGKRLFFEGAKSSRAECAAERNLHGQTRCVVDELVEKCAEKDAELADLKNAGGPPFIRSEAIRNCREEIAALRAKLAKAREDSERLQEIVNDFVCTGWRERHCAGLSYEGIINPDLLERARAAYKVNQSAAIDSARKGGAA